MFGYVKIAKPELKIKEYETYKAVYCTLCKQLGRHYGFFARLTLSYDFTFLCLLQLSLQEGCVGFEQKRCAFNPLKKCNYCKETDAFSLPAAAAMILLDYKIRDNIADEKGFKKAGNLLIRPLFSHAHKKAAKQYPDIETAVADYIKAQTALEADGCTELDRAAEPTARMLSKLLAMTGKTDAQKRVLDRMGYCLGRYIYLLDAACDLPDDLKTGSYNVLKNGLSGDAATYAKERVVPQLYFCTNEACKAFELLQIQKYKPILINILYMGLEDTMKKELSV